MSGLGGAPGARVIKIPQSVYRRGSPVRLSAAERQAQFKQDGLTLAAASDYLTDEARRYAVTADDRFLEAYWDQINVTRRRDHVLADLKQLGATQEEFDLLNLAKQNSDALADACPGRGNA